MTKAKTVIDIYRVKEDKQKEHYKSITLPCGALSVWKALVYGMQSVKNLDIDALRSTRLRKGGK